MSGATTRAARRLAAQARATRDRLRSSAATLGHATRTASSYAGLPVAKEFLVLRCSDGDDASGLFSEVAAVVGAIEFCERWHRLCAGLRVDFADCGLYHDPAVGDNWWGYYFEPIEIGSPHQAAVRVVDTPQHDAFANRVEQTMPRATAATLVARHVRVKPQLLERVGQYLRETFIEGTPAIGVHYRGTDKYEEAPPVPYAAVTAAIGEALRGVPGGAPPLYVATDDERFLDHARAAFPGMIRCLRMVRSSDGRPLHKAGRPGYRTGTDAIVDCLVLSRCRRLLRTPSNLGLFSTFFNPRLPVTVLEGRRR
jgi:hypothetical protein